MRGGATGHQEPPASTGESINGVDHDFVCLSATGARFGVLPVSAWKVGASALPLSFISYTLAPCRMDGTAMVVTLETSLTV